MLQLFFFINHSKCFVPFQGNFSQDALSMVQRSHTVSQIGYSKSLSLKSHVAFRFSATQQFGARSITYSRRITCAAAAENVSFSFWNLLVQ